ncbi:hypothetical protein EPI10_014663 [Gossypium australe]|uniref:Uncharacterized protein n=1 Tax=Gossypium australe TaxID=47621 RepID=A0A5B6VHU8_9ROSI|nr:hypothetical protein EPI10_014663 [Gossypium australe]
MDQRQNNNAQKDNIPGTPRFTIHVSDGCRGDFGWLMGVVLGNLFITEANARFRLAVPVLTRALKFSFAFLRFLALWEWSEAERAADDRGFARIAA